MLQQQPKIEELALVSEGEYVDKGTEKRSEDAGKLQEQIVASRLFIQELESKTEADPSAINIKILGDERRRLTSLEKAKEELFSVKPHDWDERNGIEEDLKKKGVADLN